MFDAVRRRRARGPALSLVVVVYRMPEQAARTLHSLSAAYQAGVGDEDYEVIVVENASDRLLGEAAVTRSGGNFRYLHRSEPEPSPVFALNAGAALSRAPMIGLMIDGARMVTPGVVRNVLRASRLVETPVVSVPGYHLGREIQQEAVDSGYGPEVEAELLRGIGWPADGYRLFEIACFSGSCGGGFFQPFAESNCLCMPRSIFDEVGGMDPRFDLPGGGNANLDLYRRACLHPRAELIVLPGEGTFHQFHGGVTTNTSKHGLERQRMMEELDKQYVALRGEGYRAPEKSPAYLGEIPPAAMRFVRISAERASTGPF
jgi:hypothetical protein